jgi:hypothetical protein
MHLMATHSLITNPDIGLDVFQHVAEMDGAVGIGQGAGDEDAPVEIAGGF